MASNNFRQTIVATGLYVSKAGHDSDAGTADEPKKSLSGMSNVNGDTNVVGAGNYVSGQTGPSIGAVASRYTIQGDGFVIIDLSGGGIVYAKAILQDLYVRHGTWDGTSVGSGASAGRTTCIFEDITGMQANIGGVPIQHTDCIFISCEYLVVNTSNRLKACFKGCIFNGIGASGVIQFQNLINSYIGSSLVIQMTLAASDPVPTVNDTMSNSNNVFANCNINGTVRLPISGGFTKDYAIQDQYVGTPQANGYAVGVNWLNETNLTADGFIGTVAGWNTLVATMINRDPKFNDAQVNNFTLQANSPHFKTGYSAVNIGSTNNALNIANTDDGVGTVHVHANADIDTSVSTAYKLIAGHTEGYVDYIFYQNGIAKKLNVITDYFFDSDYAGGTVPNNNNVVDAEPLTSTYAGKTVAGATAVSVTTIKTPTGLITAGMYVRIDGEVRLVDSVATASPNDTVTVHSAFRGIVNSGITVTYGTQAQIAALNPNRLTVQMRTSNNSVSSLPDYTTGSDWDNNVSAGYGVTGTFFNQAVKKQPGLYITGGVVYGAGDSSAPTGITLQEIGNCWIQIRIYIRNNYSSNGL